MNISKVFKTDRDCDVKTIMYDSRKKCPDSIFFAMKGRINDGHVFIDQAIDNGAICIVYTDEINTKRDNVSYVKVSDATDAYVSFCNAFYDYPTDKMNTIGVTGTNGKTTIAWIIRSIISHFNKCGYIGTRGYSLDGTIEESSLNLTTPKSDEFFRICKEMVDYGCETLVLEASSEGLLTHRLDQVKFKTAIFNNLSIEHIDVHGDMESYFKAKCILFDMLEDDGIAITNIDDEYGKRIVGYRDVRTVTYAIDNEADYMAKNIVLHPDSSCFDLIHDNKTYHIDTNMIARFNIYNMLAIVAALNENGYPIEDILEYLHEVELCDGRVEVVKAGQDFNVVVDYAFTTNSFDKVFSYAESITDKNNKIIAVFGAAGDRDPQRRPGTSKVADERADLVILTHDDPATEDMMTILKEMQTYFKRLSPEIIFNREEAIEEAVRVAEKGDTILLLGKGDDHFFIYPEGHRFYCSDKVAVTNAINKLKRNVN